MRHLSELIAIQSEQECWK